MLKAIGVVTAFIVIAVWMFGSSPPEDAPALSSEMRSQMESQTRIRKVLLEQLRSNRSGIVSEIKSLIDEGKYADAANKAGRFAPAGDKEIDRLATEARIQSRAQKENELLDKLALSKSTDPNAELDVYESLLKLQPKNEKYLSKVRQLKESLENESIAKVEVPEKAKQPEVGIRDYEVPTDTDARYTVMEIGKDSAGFTRIVTRRVSSESVLYSQRLINCKAGTYKYLGEGATREQMMGSPASPTMSPITQGSSSYYAALEACR